MQQQNIFAGLAKAEKLTLVPTDLGRVKQDVLSIPKVAKFQNYHYDGTTFTPVENSYRIAPVNGDPETTFARGVSSRHSLIQQETIFTKAIEVIEESNFPIDSVALRHSDFGEWARLTVLFEQKEKNWSRSVGEEIAFGFNLTSSIDTSSSIRGSAFIIRLLCLNGMTVPDVFESFNVRHVGEGATGRAFDRLATFMDNLYNTVEEKLPGIYSKAKVKLPSLEKTYIVPLLIGHGFGITDAVTINTNLNHLASYGEPLNADFNASTRWDLYNATTAYITHYKAAGPQRTDALFGYAYKLLDADLDNKAVEKGEKTYVSSKRGKTPKKLSDDDSLPVFETPTDAPSVNISNEHYGF